MIAGTTSTDLSEGQEPATHFGPVSSIGDVVEVPAGGEDGVEPTGRHLLHLILPAFFPHVYHCVGQHLLQQMCVCVCVCVEYVPSKFKGTILCIHIIHSTKPAVKYIKVNKNIFLSVWH